ncbi:hypothetical protein NCS56_01215100 [Fusarium sp. Ph1]|nr:hypothetical protein NCS56_01215100 [Fusarium sp. Ph1]
MTRDRVLESLDLRAQGFINTIVPLVEKSPGLLGQGLVKIYALLTLVDKSEQILAFIEEGLRDKDLPLRYDDTDFFRDEEALKCFQSWKPPEKGRFSIWQWGFVVPFFQLEPDGSPKHYNLDSRAIIPWIYDSTVPVLEIAGVSDREFSGVYRIAIDPDSQGLWEQLQQIGLDDSFFALRALSPNYLDEEMFAEELDRLWRLSETGHENLATLLASISHGRRYYFLFPYAECTLLQFWEDLHPEPPPHDMEETQWLIRQLTGLVGAMGTIHGHLCSHGGITAQDIHRFRSSHDPRGHTMLSCYGLSSPSQGKGRSDFGGPGRQRLRWNFPDDMSWQSCDIWSLGFVLLEFVIWFLGGVKLVRQFESQLISQFSSDNTETSTPEGYTTERGTYAVDMFQLGESLAAQSSRMSRSRGERTSESSLWSHVNREALEWAVELHHHQNCTRAGSSRGNS